MCLHHKHLDWEKYINDEVPNRDDYEQALATCTYCLQEYIDLVQGDLVSPSPGFTETIMKNIPNHRRYNYRPLVHYLVAACLTLVLFEWGAFDWILTGSQHVTLEAQLYPAFLQSIGNVWEALKTNLGGM